MIRDFFIAGCCFVGFGLGMLSAEYFFGRPSEEALRELSMLKNRIKLNEQDFERRFETLKEAWNERFNETITFITQPMEDK